MKKNLVLIKNILNLEIIVITQENLEEPIIIIAIEDIKYQKKFIQYFITVHFIIKQLTKDFNGEFDCLGEDTEKYITFSAPIYKKIIMMKQSYTN